MEMQTSTDSVKREHPKSNDDALQSHPSRGIPPTHYTPLVPVSDSNSPELQQPSTEKSVLKRGRAQDDSVQEPRKAKKIVNPFSIPDKLVAVIAEDDANVALGSILCNPVPCIPCVMKWEDDPKKICRVTSAFSRGSHCYDCPDPDNCVRFTETFQSILPHCKGLHKMAISHYNGDLVNKSKWHKTLRFVLSTINLVLFPEASSELKREISTLKTELKTISRAVIALKFSIALIEGNLGCEKKSRMEIRDQIMEQFREETDDCLAEAAFPHPRPSSETGHENACSNNQVQDLEVIDPMEIQSENDGLDDQGVGELSIF